MQYQIEKTTEEKNINIFERDQQILDKLNPWRKLQRK